MIYLFTGTDTGKTRAKAFQWIEASRKKAPDAVYLRIAPDAVTDSSLAEAAGAQGLFFSKALVLIDDPFSLKESGETVLAQVNLLAESPNAIAILAPKAKAAELRKIESKAERVFVLDLARKKESRGFNAALVNALAAKQGEALWLEIERALRAGDAPEMIHGLLHWKARDLMEKGGRAWSEKEARALSLGLIELMSDARSASLDLGVALERFALSLGPHA